MTPTKIIEKRLRQLDEVRLEHGPHSPDQHVAKRFCINEAAAWLAGEEEISDHPDCVSPTIRSFSMRFNDRLDDEGLERLKTYAPKIVGTRDDGQEDERRRVLNDWAFRTALPFWLELAGQDDDAKWLREQPDLSSEDIEYGSPFRKRLSAISERSYTLREEHRRKIRGAVREELRKRGVKGAAAAAAADVAAAAAAAAAVAAAVAAAAAADVAAAVDVAVDVDVAAAAAAAAAADVAVAVDVAAAAAADVAVDVAAAVAAPWNQTYIAVKQRLIPIYRKKLDELLDGRQPPSGFDLLDQLIDPKAAAA